ncbi:MAG: NYN domain-containing protein [Longimicrobiaceae bacterium]
MNSYSNRSAPHAGGQPYPTAPNAALLIDFDNVTMGIRSDLGKELKTLLNSEVIRGKVAVQRAYADWRRYPQYIVPLAESSIDLIFAPAYGSSKKNATDLRMAIDAMELVFIRPEIGTFILLTGDSDFSSCVLKLKEYGKYVIGVGMRESSSDLLIQNCDEYYSYHALSGLTRAGEDDGVREDPWTLVRRAVEKMASGGDAMRSDRLKQVMMEMDAGFDEKKLGYSKFSRFVSEAAGKGLITLRKGANGQYEIGIDGATSAPAPSESRPEPRERGRRNGRRRGGRSEPSAPPPEPIAQAEPVAEAPAATTMVVESAQAEAPAAGMSSDLDAAYALLQHAVRTMGSGSSHRDGDVKRKMMDMSADFDESNVGFSKFSRFLRQAHEDEVVDVSRTDSGYEVGLASGGKRYPDPQLGAAQAPPAEPAAVPDPQPEPTASTDAEAAPATATQPAARVSVRGRRSSRGRGAAPDAPPPLLPDQVVVPPAEQKAKPESKRGRGRKPAADKQPAAETKAPAAKRGRGGRAAKRPDFSPAALNLPTDGDAIAGYLSNSYRGVGAKTAESLVGAFGSEVFRVLQQEPDRVREQLGARRADALLEQWIDDYARRLAESTAPGGLSPAPVPPETPPQRSVRGRRGGRSRPKSGAPAS